jgi:hypothetical protein
MPDRFVFAMFAILAACGGGGGKSNDAPDIDAKVFMDAPAPMIDAPPPTMGLGQPCTPGATPQGDCPTGFECLNLNGGTGKWCSKTCMTGAMDMCAVGYTGPGRAQCIYNIMDGMATRQFCGVVCQDTTGSCPASQCNGMCPTPLTCTAELKNTSMAVVGHACF